MVLLFDIQFIVLKRGMLAKVSHVDINLSLALTHIRIYLTYKKIVALCKSWIVFSYLVFILLELPLHMYYELLEMILQDQLVDD